jgi:hypothetical protein
MWSDITSRRCYGASLRASIFSLCSNMRRLRGTGDRHREFSPESLRSLALSGHGLSQIQHFLRRSAGNRGEGRRFATFRRSGRSGPGKDGSLVRDAPVRGRAHRRRLRHSMSPYLDSRSPCRHSGSSNRHVPGRGRDRMDQDRGERSSGRRDGGAPSLFVGSMDQSPSIVQSSQEGL